MEDNKKTKKQLIEELHELRQSVAKLKGFEKEIEQAGVNQEKFTKAFLQNSIPTIITTVKEDIVVEVSDDFLRLVGKKRDEVIGYTAVENGFITKEQRAFFFNEVSKSGRVENFEMEMRTQSGALRYGLFNAVMMSVNNEIYLLTNVQDITDRKLAEKALQNSEESKRQLLNAAGDGIFGVDATGQLTFVNPAALQMLGYAEQEILGQAGPKVHALIHHSHADGSKYSVDDCPMFASYTHGTDHYMKDELLWRKDGSSFPVEYSSMAIIQDSKIMGAVVTFKDITQRKQAEEALKEEHRQLQQALDEIRTLRGIVPICSYCKKIRDDEGYWNQVEQYVSKHTEAQFSHGICPTCFEREMKGIKGET